MIKIKQIRFGQSVFVGDKEMNYIRASNAPHLEVYYDEINTRFVILNSKSKQVSEIWVYPTNVQFVEPMERVTKVDEDIKESGKTRSSRA